MFVLLLVCKLHNPTYSKPSRTVVAKPCAVISVGLCNGIERVCVFLCTRVDAGRVNGTDSHARMSLTLRVTQTVHKWKRERRRTSQSYAFICAPIVSCTSELDVPRTPLTDDNSHLYSAVFFLCVVS